MQPFHCQSCGNAIYFENVTCNRCGHSLGVLPDVRRMSALEPAGEGLWRPLAPEAGGRLYRQCDNNREHQVCNWMVPADEDRELCDACRFNNIIPRLSRPENLDRWTRLERGKRRLIYSLVRLGLPLLDKQQSPAQGLAFSFMSSRDAPPDEPVLTGHASGLITINIDEADSVLRERARLDMDEHYRTLVGHFRHEIGHYYWDLLIRDGGLIRTPLSAEATAAGEAATSAPTAPSQERLDAFRALFGDERADYGEALEAHYQNGPPPDWQERHISAYAASHPWEDWAETWAHYLHIVDTLETAHHFGVQVERWLADGTVQRADPEFDAYLVNAFDPLIENWIPLTFALNSLNRSMGIADLYPFVISGPVIDKLRFVHETVRASRIEPTSGPPPLAKQRRPGWFDFLRRR